MASGVSQPPSPPRPIDGRALTCEQFIEGQLRKTSNGVKAVDLAFALMLLVVATLGFFGLMALLDHWIVPGGLSTWARAAFFVFFFGGAISYIVLRVVPILLGRINPVYAAYTIEHSAPALKNSLLNFLLFRGRQRGEVPEPVYQALEQQAAAKLSTVPVELAVDRSKILYVGYVLMALAVVCGLYKVLSPKDPIVTAQRVLLPWADILPPSRVKIEEIKPGTVSAVRGEVVQVSAHIKGLGEQEEVKLVYTTDDGQAVDRVLPMIAADGGDVFTCGLPESEAGLQEALVYRIEAGDAVSHQHRIDVITAPTIALKTVFLQFPEYTKLVDRRYVRDGNLRAIEGTKVSLRVETNSEIKTAWVDFENDKRRDLEMTHKGTEAWVTFTLELDAERRAAKHGSYSLRFTNAEGRSNHDPVEYRIEVVPDIAPEISFLQPEPSERETEVPLDGTLIIETSAIDPDYALAKVELHGKVGEKEVFLRPLLEKSHSGQFVTKYELVPSKESLKAGDVVDYWAVAIDNKTPQANRTETEQYRFKVIAPEHPEDNQLAQNDPRNKPEQDPNAKPDENNDGQPMPDKQNPANDKQDPNQKQDPDQQNPEKQSDEKEPDSVKQKEKEQEEQGDQQGNPQQGDESKEGGKQESGDGSGKPDKKQKSKENSKPGEKGQQGGDGNGGSQGEPSDEAPDSEDAKSDNSQGGKPTGKKSDSKSPGSESNPEDSDTPEGDAGGEPGKQGSKNGQKQGKPSEDSELADQNQQPEEVAKDDEGTVFERLKNAIAEKKEKEKEKGEDSAENNTAQQKPGQKSEDQLAQGSQKHEPGEKQGDAQSGNPREGEQPMPPGEHPTESNQPGEKKTGQQRTGEKPEDQQPMGQKPDGQNPGEEKAGEKNSDQQKPGDSKSEENGAGKEDPLFDGEQGAKEKPDKNSDGSAKKQAPEKKPMPAGESGEKQGEESGDMGNQDSPGEKPNGQKQPGGGTNAKQGTEQKEGPEKKQGEKAGNDPGAEQKPTEGQNPHGDGGAGSKSKDEQKPTPDAQGKINPKERPTKEPGKEDEKKSEDAKSPGHGRNESDSQGQQDGDKSGGGKEGGGQKAPLPGTGSPGSNTASDQGTGKANDAGDMGETSDQGGNKEPAKQAPKTEGEKKAGEGREKRPDEKTPGQQKANDGNKPGNEKSQPSDGQQGKPGEGQNSNAPPTDANGEPVGGDGTREGKAAPSNQGEAPLATDPNLEYSRKATDLVLDYLENQLQQDELSREVQEQLPGWTKEDIQQLVDRARSREQAAKGQGPESSQAKKEFEDWLRSLGLKKNTGRGVTQQSGAKDDTQGGLRQTRGAKAPAEYADQVEAYKKGLSRENRPRE